MAIILFRLHCLQQNCARSKRERDKKKTWILLLSIFHLFIHTHTLLLSRFSLITKQQQQKKRIRKCRIWTDKQKTRQKLIFHKENTEKRQKLNAFRSFFTPELNKVSRQMKRKWNDEHKKNRFFFLLFFLEWIKRETEKIFYLISIEAWRIAENVPSLSILIFCLFIRTKKWHEKKKPNACRYYIFRLFIWELIYFLWLILLDSMVHIWLVFGFSKVSNQWNH